MGELKLNNLVDLVLVVGADSNSGLELHINSSAHPRMKKKNQRKNADVDNNNHKYNNEGNGKTDPSNNLLNGNDGNHIGDEDLAFHLADPKANYRTNVLQVFSSSAANYPSRKPEEQLTGYPHELFIPANPYHNGQEEDDEETLPDSFNEGFAQMKARNRRHTSFPGSMLQDSALRKSSLSYISATAGGRKSSIAFNQTTRRYSTPATLSNVKPVAIRKTKTAEMPLSAEQIGAICNLSFPDGFRCSEYSRKPAMTSYVLTDVDGDRFYAVSLTFHRPFVVTPAPFKTNDLTPRYSLANAEVVKPDEDKSTTMYIPTSVVLVTSYPYYNTLQKCLTELYASMQPKFTDLDDQVKRLAVVLTNVPVPPSGGELSLTFQTRKHGLKLTVHPATHPSRSVTDFNLSLAFTILSTDVMCTAIAALLQEQRLVLVSSRYALFTLVMEALMHLIYPFRWQSMYVPVLPANMLGLLEAPGYFVMGCHSDNLPTIKMVEGLVVIDLDSGKLISTDQNEWPSRLPLKAASTMCTKLIDLEMNFELATVGKVIADSSLAKEEFERKLNNDLLDIGLSMMADMFGDIYEHIITDQKFFDKAAFLARQPADDQQFYTEIVNTTMFKAFLREIFADLSPEPWTVKALEREMGRRSSSRASRSLQSKEQKRSLVAIQYENSCKAFSLPAMLTLDQFQEDTLLNLSSFVGLPTTAKCSQAAALYVMGVVCLQRKQLPQALNSFGDLQAIDSDLFPAEEIGKALNSLECADEVLEDVLTQHQKLYRDLLKTSQAKRKNFCTDVKVDLENLPKVAIGEQEFSKYAERLDLAVGRDTINRLYQALSLGMGALIEPDHLKTFYECWKDNEASCREMEVILSAKSAEFSDVTVLKASPSMVRTDYGLGTVVLTTSNLLLLKNGAKMESIKQIARISNIAKLQMDSALVVLSQVECVQVFVNGSVKPINLFLDSDSKAWLVLLKELIGGKFISTNSRDTFLMQQAADNVLLLDALIMSSRVSSPPCLHSKNLNRAIELLTFFSKEETKHQLLISCEATKDILLYKLNPNADELDSGSVECIVYVPGIQNSSNRRSSMYKTRSVSVVDGLAPTVWCGMSNGKIRIFDATSWRLYPRFVQAVDRVVCLLHFDSQIWAGSFDHNIYVIENSPQVLEYQVLSQHKDFVVDMQIDPQAKNSIFSADISGVIIQWDSLKLEVIKQFMCSYNPLTSFKVISHEEIWCCCTGNLVKMNNKGLVKSTLFYIDERDRRMHLECFCIIGCDIWAGCSQTGRLVIWDKNDETRRALLPLDSRGIGQVVAIGNSLYVGCKASHPSRKSLTGGNLVEEVDLTTKSKLYIINAQQYQIVEELSAHNDSIRSMFAVSHHYVLTGSASREGKIVIWKHQAEPEVTSV